MNKQIIGLLMLCIAFAGPGLVYWLTMKYSKNDTASLGPILVVFAIVAIVCAIVIVGLGQAVGN